MKLEKRTWAGAGHLRVSSQEWCSLTSEAERHIYPKGEWIWWPREAREEERSHNEAINIRRDESDLGWEVTEEGNAQPAEWAMAAVGGRG